MPAYKDKNKTWYVKFYYYTSSGEHKQKRKTGFKTKKEALQYEKSFIEQYEETPDAKFSVLYGIFLKDKKARTKYTTWHHTEWAFEKYFLPAFGDMPVNTIEPKHIRAWQTMMLNATKEDGSPYSPTYIKRLEKELSGYFNFLVKFHGLKSNPMQVFRSVGSTQPDEEMKIWSEDEFQQAISYEKEPDYYAAFNTLFYTGMRIGELRALTWGDINFDEHYISINKNLQYTEIGECFTTPKTKESKRLIYIDSTLESHLKAYKKMIYDPSENDRLFTHPKTSYGTEIHKLANQAGVKHIRVHDLRHSHASYLISLGASIVLISKRLGHKSIKMTLDKYSHLYPDESKTIADTISKKRVVQK